MGPVGVKFLYMPDRPYYSVGKKNAGSAAQGRAIGAR